MRFQTPRLHLAPSPAFTHGTAGFIQLQPPTAENPGLLTEDEQPILDEQGNVIIE